MKPIIKTEGRAGLFTQAELRKLIIPLIFEQALAIMVGTADTMMISSVGEAAVSGVSLVDMMNILIINIMAALATGGAVVTSQLLGAGNKKKACASASQLIFVTAVFAAALALLMILFRRGLMHLFFGSITQEVYDNAIIYLIYTALSFPFLGVYNSCAALFRSMGNSQITLKISILMNLINVCGNAVCIFGLHMGTAGVAIPSLISRAVAAVLILKLLRNRDLTIHLTGEKFRPDPDLIRRILFIGVPSGFENGIFQLGKIMVGSIVSTFGTWQIAANGVAGNLMTMGCIAGNGLNLAMITVVGRCVGAGDSDQVRYYTKVMMGKVYLYTAAQNIVLLLLMKPLLSLYGLGPEAAALAYKMAVLHTVLAAFFWPLSFSLPNMLRACNDVRFTMIVAIASMCIFRLGFSVILGVHFGMGALGVCYAMFIDWGCRIVCFVFRYLSGAWKKQAHLT